MNRNYILLTVLLLVLSGGLLFLPERSNTVQVAPEDLMLDIVQPTRYISTDKVARMIIEKDPLLLLIDVRSDYEFEEFSLPGSVNLPMDSLLTDYADDILNIEDVNTVLFSDDDIKADQSWVIAKRLGYKNIYVMKGGLNCWITTVIEPEPPAETSPVTDFELYRFRQGASAYFTGTDISGESGEKVKLNVTRRKKETVAEGGC
jgi:rhodanese-related sulfurtransferase